MDVRKFVPTRGAADELTDQGSLWREPYGFASEPDKARSTCDNS
jgi:hypothetical protein